MNFVFQKAFYCHVCHRSLCVISYQATMAKERVFKKWTCYDVRARLGLQGIKLQTKHSIYLHFCGRVKVILVPLDYGLISTTVALFQHGKIMTWLSQEN